MTLSNSERYDLVLDTTGKERRTYRMRVAGSPTPFSPCRGLAAIAFLRYGDSEVDQTARPDYVEEWWLAWKG